MFLRAVDTKKKPKKRGVRTKWKENTILAHAALTKILIKSQSPLPRLLPRRRLPRLKDPPTRILTFRRDARRRITDPRRFAIHHPSFLPTALTHASAITALRFASYDTVIPKKGGQHLPRCSGQNTRVLRWRADTDLKCRPCSIYAFPISLSLHLSVPNQTQREKQSQRIESKETEHTNARLAQPQWALSSRFSSADSAYRSRSRLWRPNRTSQRQQRRQETTAASAAKTSAFRREGRSVYVCMQEREGRESRRVKTFGIGVSSLQQGLRDSGTWQRGVQYDKQ